MQGLSLFVLEQQHKRGQGCSSSIGWELLEQLFNWSLMVTMACAFRGLAFLKLLLCMPGCKEDFFFMYERIVSMLTPALKIRGTLLVCTVVNLFKTDIDSLF